MENRTANQPEPPRPIGRVAGRVQRSCYDHSSLVGRAGRWLRYSAVVTERIMDQSRQQRVRCGVVLTELITYESETPDAIGWFQHGRWSILVEAKASRADFLADKNKTFRMRPDSGMGAYRYYMAPEGIITPDDLPDRWGLLEVRGKTVTVVVAAKCFDRWAERAERTLLWSALRRVQGS